MDGRKKWGAIRRWPVGPHAIRSEVNGSVHTKFALCTSTFFKRSSSVKMNGHLTNMHGQSGKIERLQKLKFLDKKFKTNHSYFRYFSLM